MPAERLRIFISSPGDVAEERVLANNLVRRLSDEVGERLWIEPIFWEHEGNRAVRDGKWKLVAKGEKAPWELYDMEADRTEMHDLASQNADRVKQMGDAWRKWAEEAHVLPMLPQDKGPKKKKGAGQE